VVRPPNITFARTTTLFCLLAQGITPFVCSLSFLEVVPKGAVAGPPVACNTMPRWTARVSSPYHGERYQWSRMENTVTCLSSRSSIFVVRLSYLCMDVGCICRCKHMLPVHLLIVTSLAHTSIDFTTHNPFSTPLPFPSSSSAPPPPAPLLQAGRRYTSRLMMASSWWRNGT
jgi:hypothetical protein